MDPPDFTANQKTGTSFHWYVTPTDAAVLASDHLFCRKRPKRDGRTIPAKLEQPGPALADLDFLIVNKRQHLAGVAHVEPIATPWAPHACLCAIKAILGE